ncbi:MAG TPA: ABC transporter substrate-binding protein [Candidatus Saccharimonadales bacterium]|nr:ABC transporter substrate-binding protein [Candidatus Saccharimonadales bacterium]
MAEITPQFHPLNGQSNQYMLFYLVFDNLVKLDTSDPALQTIVPDLADSWQISPDGTTFTFHLHPGVMWQDGTAFTAQDVVYTATWGAENFAQYQGFPPAWNYLQGAAAAAGTTKAVAGVTAPDPNTVVFKLAAPNAYFLRDLADAPNAIMPQHILNGMSATQILAGSFIKSPIGTGPYKFASINPGQDIEFDANPNYFLGAPKIAKIFYKYETPDSALSDIQAGSLDLLLDGPPSEATTLASAPNVQIFKVPSPGIVSLTAQDDNPRWANPLVRQAMYYGIDRRGIVASVLQGNAKVLIGPPGFKEYSDLNTYPYDVAKAKALLQQANFDFSKPVKLIWSTDWPDNSAVVPVIVQQLDALGMNVVSEPLASDPWTALVTDPTKRSTFDLDISTGGSEGLGPDRSQLYYLCNQPVGVSIGYENCDMINLFNKAATIIDPTARDAVYHQLALIFNSQVPQLYLWSPLGIQVASKRLGGGFKGVPSFSRYVTMNAATWSVSQ